MTTMKFAAVVCFCVAFLPPSLRADEWDKKTIFTFNAPVEVPGQVLLPGSYVFKLLNTQSDRHIVQVFNKDQTHLYGTFLTIPDYRMTPPSKPLITFEERPAGSPEAIKAWFYPGDNFGNEFVYPKNRAVEMAKSSQQNVPSMPSALSSNTKTATESQNGQQVTEMKQADLKAEEPSGQEVEVAKVFVVAVPVPGTPEQEIPASAETPLVALADEGPPELPKTASSGPLIGLIGVLSLAAGLALGRRSRRSC
ncbi:MAG TPA: LPXTG cell wall anchor domain-containing protein [Bryobacteraceae bacterium]|jgi:LPXTG-motif cell wall-anchored protein